MSEPITIANDRVVLFHYVLKDAEGELIDSSGAHPITYLHGHGNILPGLERALEGAKVGDELHVEIEPKDAYGERIEGAEQSIHRSQLPKDREVAVGMPLQFRSDDGKVAVLWVTAVRGARITLTPNHPLAGKTLHFDVAIAGSREASAEEIHHGHAHGPGGHHH